MAVGNAFERTQQMGGDERLTIEAGWFDPDSFQVLVPPAYADEFRALLAEHGVEQIQVVHAAGGGSGDLLFEIIGAAGACASVAAALLAFFARHKGKRFHLRFGDQEFTAEDCSAKQAEEWMKAALEQVDARARRGHEIDDCGVSGET